MKIQIPFLIMLVVGAGAVVYAEPIVSLVKMDKSKKFFAYQYRVVNKSENAIVDVSIGEDGCRNGEFELIHMPEEWASYKGVSKKSVREPLGWKAQVVTQEESDKVSVSWKVQDQAKAIAPGASSENFIVVSSTLEPAYQSGHWTVIDNHGQTYSGVLGRVGKKATWQGGSRTCP